MTKLFDPPSYTTIYPTSAIIIQHHPPFPTAPNTDHPTLACVASVSNRVRAEAEKKGGRGRGRREEETLARKPHDSEKRPLIFHGSARL